MQKKIRLKDLLTVITLVTIIAGVSHYVITNPLGPSRLLYYIQAPIIQWQTRCSDSAPSWMAQLQRYTTRNMGAPASQLVWIAPRGELSHCETGWKDEIFGHQPLQPDTRFRFASTTKTVTAIAILELINEGRLSLDDSIVEVLELEGELKHPKVGEITVEHLLSHRAGWDRVRTQDVMFMMGVKPWCPYSPEKLKATTLMYEPGEKESYSNLGYCLLGLAAEKVTGQSFREYISQGFNFSENNLRFIDGSYLPDEVRYDFRHEDFYMENYHTKFDFAAVSSSAGLSGSASDLARLVASSLQQGPLTILDGDMNRGCDSSEIQECYGYGLYRYQPEGKEPLYIHDGKLPGATSAIIVTPSKGVLVWLGAGAAKPGSNALQSFYDYVRETVVE